MLQGYFLTTIKTYYGLKLINILFYFIMKQKIQITKQNAVDELKLILLPGREARRPAVQPELPIWRFHPQKGSDLGILNSLGIWGYPQRILGI